MSAQICKVASLILLDLYGPVVETVGSYLFRSGPSSLYYIKKNTDLPVSKIKESLRILIKYRLVTFTPNKNENIANYTIDSEKVLLLLRYPKYINLIKRNFGVECEMMVEEVLQKSYLTASELILIVYDRLHKDNSSEVTFQQLKSYLESLITAKYLIRLQAECDKPVPTLSTCDKEAVFHIDVNFIVKAHSDKALLAHLPDTDIFWTANFDRFHQDMRDKIIVSGFSKKFDENAGEFIRLLLLKMYVRTEPWADISNPVPILEIRDILRKQATHPQLNAFFDQYVSVIEQDSNRLIRKAGEASGGSLQIAMKEIFVQFAWETIEQIILEKFDTLAVRTFRLVKCKQFIEPDQIHQLAMISATTAKRLCYHLVEENFLQVQELRKAPSNNGPNKSFSLFHIDLQQVVRMILEESYKTLFNILTRKNHEKVVNKRIIDKKQRVDTVAMGMRAQGATEEQLADIEEMITPPEKEILQKIDRIMKKLNTLEMEIDETIFLLQIFLMYHN